MRILYYFPFEFYSRKMSIGRSLYGEAVERTRGVEFMWTGPGWPGYVDELSLCENLNRDGFDPDVVWLYKVNLGSETPGKVRVVTFNEAWGEQYIAEAYSANANLVVFHHENDWRRWQLPLKARGIKGVHLPHCAEAVTAALPFDERPIDCLFTGVSSASIYPLRERLRRLVTLKRLPGEIRPHPGYRLNGREKILEQYADYLRHLGRAKISLCCTSKWKYALEKIPQSMMQGCAVATDCPDDSLFRRELWPHVIQLHADWSDDMIVGTIRDWLDRPEDLRALAERGRRAVVEGFSTDCYARRLVDACASLLP